MDKYYHHEPYLKPYSQRLRREMTKEEKHLWYDFLRKLPYPVKRQHMIGSYIVDFYIAAAFLIIEVDGNQHGEDEQLQSDIERDKWLTNEGYRVLRYPNSLLHEHFEDVCNDIWSCLEN